MIDNKDNSLEEIQEQSVIDDMRHEQSKFFDGFSHPKDCPRCLSVCNECWFEFENGHAKTCQRYDPVTIDEFINKK